MNALIPATILIIWLVLGYKIYGRFIEKKVLQVDPSRPTPARELNDGIDYSPAKKALLFGHHFSSIAGAGPILGPLLGVLYFGWLGALLWVALGSVFLGAVHDFTSLMTSVQNKGRSLADISEQTLGRRTKIIFSIFLWMALALVIAVFAVVASRTLVSQPQIVIPTFGLIFLAMLFGWMVYRKNINIIVGTATALIVLGILIYFGELFPVILPSSILGLSPQKFWFFTLIVYSLFASALPVWFLLQPRDYISTWILFLGLGLGYLGLVVFHPQLNAPSFTSFRSEGGPLWPMLFVIIACGAISGFHSVVAAGTTAKQLSNENAGRAIGYGAMITESALAGLVIFIAAGALLWDPSGAKQTFGFQYIISSSGDPIRAFAVGYGRLINSLPGLTLAMGTFFGMVMLNAFVLTTLDTGTRLGRFIFSELFDDYGSIWKNRWLASGIILIVAAILGASEGYKAIWPVFGASNQLVAALALLVVTSYLTSRKRPKKYTLYPAIFMLFTTLGALIYQGYSFIRQGSYLLALICIVLMALAAIIVIDARQLFRS
ncbi:MAG: carbon starvation protein A [Candidatus Aminicenantes bacterium 4484_214]|nr:MAG: carbon starvation protein A [Candidatus Aminicenantes bacterium 4484_214]